MIADSHPRLTVSSFQTTGTNSQASSVVGQHHYSYRVSCRNDQNAAPGGAATRIVTPAATAPVDPWTLDQWKVVAQHYYQQACQLKKENEAWKAHYQKLYRTYQYTRKALLEAQSACDEAKNLAKRIIGLKMDSKKA